MRGIDAFLEILAAAGVRYLFGNPGTTELPLCDAMTGDSRLQYILGLQEIPVMAMADGYAMASGKLGVVNVHICAGLGNAMGMLYNSFRSGTPLLLTAGQQDRRLQFEEPILWGDMLGVVRPWTKWAVEVQRVEDIPSALRRAMQMALTPPTGPVFLSIPLDLQTASAEMDLTLSDPPDPELLPSATAIQRAADVLLSAERPGILVGSRVIEHGAVSELVAVAEQLRTRFCRSLERRMAGLDSLQTIRCMPKVCRSGRPRFASGSRNSTRCWSSAWIYSGPISITNRPAHCRSTFGSCISTKTPFNSARTIRSRPHCWEARKAD